MPNVALKGHQVQGMTAGEHAGHYDELGSPIHGSCTLTGTIQIGSPKLKVNGVEVALAGHTTLESDCCDAGQTGTLLSINRKLKVNGINVSCQGDDITPHNGTAAITEGSTKIQTV